MTAADWIEGYKKAWASNEPDDIRALFTDDARYQTSPTSPWREGIDTIVEGWIADRDEPGHYTFEYEVLEETSTFALVRGVTDYSPVNHPTYDNLWVIRFAPDGRATEFIEFYKEREKS